MTSVERLLEISAYAVYLNTLIGSPPPAVKTLHDRISKPEIDDLVLEVSTIHHVSRTGTRLGWLRRIEREWSNPEWANLPEDERPDKEPVWYIEGLDGVTYRWWNANFIVVLTDLGQLREPPNKYGVREAYYQLRRREGPHGDWEGLPYGGTTPQ